MFATPLLLAACIENELGDHKEDPPFQNDTSAETGSPETGDTGTPSDPECADQVFDGYAGSQDGACSYVPTVGTFTPVIEWSIDTFSVDVESRSVMMTPIVVSLTDEDGDGDADEDDVPDIVFITYPSTSWTGPGTLRAVSGDGSGEIWNVSGAALDGSGGLAAGDLDDDGFPEILAPTQSRALVAYDHDGNLLWESDNLSTDMGDYGCTPAISDMDGDGTPEIVIGRAILDATGDTLGAGTAGKGEAGVYGSSSFPVDIDGDGVQEVVVGNALYDMYGNSLWTNGLGDGYVAAADFDHDGLGEIVVSGSGSIRLQDDDGAVIWNVPIPLAGPSYGGPPTIADFDGDGEPEVGVAANSTYTVFEGADGTVLWQNVTQDGSSGVTGSSVYDFEGDGIADVVYADETQLWVFNGVDGAVKLNSPDHSSWTVVEYPVIADVDGDGEAEIVVARNLHPSYTSAALYGIAVFGDADHSWRPGRKIWNQHAYHITNVSDDGSLPPSPDRNWEIYNNFRSGDIEVDAGYHQPDLTVAQADICELDCEDGRISLWVNAGNVGDLDVTTPVDVDVYATENGVERWMATQTIREPVVVGRYLDSLQFNLEGLDMAGLERLRVYIFPAPDECDPDNNTTAWEGPFCVAGP